MQGRSMPSVTAIPADKLVRLIGTPHCPALVDVRAEDEFEADPRLIPGSMRRPYADPSNWAGEFLGRSAIVICRAGGEVSEGTAAWLRHAGVPADILEDGFEGWRNDRMPLLATANLPRPDGQGRTVWVTRARPKVDRIACPWLIRRFVDPRAVFLFVAAAEVERVAERFAATPFDIEGALFSFSDRGDLCTFDAMVEEFGLATDPLLHLAAIVRGADTGRMDVASQASGLLAASLGLSRMYSDDLAQLEAGLALYDALYRWCRDATEETHTTHSKKREA
jgi:rhodanese-related sulfurtransferase